MPVDGSNIFEVTVGSRLFTYKVKTDRGSAPNPYGVVCSLAICKPRIRRVAKSGDLVAGFGCREDSDRLIYLMIVDRCLSWSDYIEICRNEELMKCKIPLGEHHPGDCIWESAVCQLEPKKSWSMHMLGDFNKDVTSGRNVLLGSVFWYFGRGDRFTLRLPEHLTCIVPRGVGHRSNANRAHKEHFISWFVEEVSKLGIKSGGKYGEPQTIPEHD